jgi:hypothetical protein
MAPVAEGTEPTLLRIVRTHATVPNSHPTREVIIGGIERISEQIEVESGDEDWSLGRLR